MDDVIYNDCMSLSGTTSDHCVSLAMNPDCLAAQQIVASDSTDDSFIHSAPIDTEEVADNQSGSSSSVDTDT